MVTLLKKYRHRIYLAFIAAALFTLAVVSAFETSTSSLTTSSTSSSPRRLNAFGASSPIGASTGPTLTVGQTVSAQDLQFPAIRSADAAPQPTDWSARVIFKGCGQTVSVRLRAGKELLLYNGGTVNRYIRGTGGLPLVFNGVHTIVPRDWREGSFAKPGQYVITFTTATCTLWAPKVVVTIS